MQSDAQSNIQKLLNRTRWLFRFRLQKIPMSSVGELNLSPESIILLRQHDKTVADLRKSISLDYLTNKELMLKEERRVTTEK